jgi:hypothetical protein
MNTTTRIRVLIHCNGAGAGLFRTLVSLACQTIGPQRLNVILASTAPAEHTTTEARLLHSALGFGSLTVLDATGMHPAKALNVAALEGREEWLALTPEGTRLSPRFLASCLQAGQDPKTHAVYPAHTAGTPDNTPLTRMRPFNPEQLTRRNPVGPAVLVRRAAWETAGGLRPEVPLALWDLWLRLALTGGNITRLPELLAHCRPLHRLTSGQDGHAKALLVVSTPGAFEPDVCRWALALLRGEPWAKPFDAGVIPGPREVRDLFSGYEAPSVPSHTGWALHGICSA